MKQDSELQAKDDIIADLEHGKAQDSELQAQLKAKDDIIVDLGHKTG
jgi:hypothetical protein